MVHGKTILVLGGGIGGVVAATHLRRLLPHEHRVILIEREFRHVFSPVLSVGDGGAAQCGSELPSDGGVGQTRH